MIAPNTAIRPSRLVYISAILAMLLWGLSFVWTSIVLKYYSPITTIFLRLLISSILLYVSLKIAKRLDSIRRKDIPLLLASALFNPFLYFIGENFGIKYSSATISAVVIATIPVFTPIFGYFLLRERLTILNYLGILLSFAGVVIMLVNPNLTFVYPSKGMAYLFFAVFTAVIYSVLLKKLTLKYNAFSIITYQNILGTVYILPIFLIFEFREFIAVTPTFELYAAILQLAVFASSLAFVFFTIAIKHIGISRANVYTNLIPVITGIFSFFVLDELFTIKKILGMAIVIFGVGLSQMRYRWRVKA